MNEIIERAAQAIYEKYGGQILAGMGAPVPAWSEIHPSFKEIFRAQARDVIEVLQEPDDVMLDAGYDVSHPVDGAIAYGVVAEIWREMIKAALRDQITVSASPPPPPDTGGLVKRGI